MIHSFILTREHSNFLREERKDPITQDRLEIGNEIVFCGKCKSAYLKDTWLLYNGCCEQKSTLSEFPISKLLNLGKKTIPKFVNLNLSKLKKNSTAEDVSSLHGLSYTSFLGLSDTTQEINNRREEEERLRAEEKRLRAEERADFVFNFISRGIKISFIFIILVWLISLFTG